MTVITQTQSEQASSSYTPAPRTPGRDEQSLRDELRVDSQQFFRTLFRMGIRLVLAPVNLLSEEPRGHFVSAGREFTRGFTSLAHELADTVDKIVDEVESDLTRDA